MAVDDLTTQGAGISSHGIDKISHIIPASVLEVNSLIPRKNNYHLKKMFFYF